MTRKEQLKEYLKERNIPIDSLEANSIIEGVEWADENRLDFNFNDIQEIRETLNTPKEENKDGMIGWICPKCGRCYSPFVNMCPICNNGTWNNTITYYNGTMQK